MPRLSRWSLSFKLVAFACGAVYCWSGQAADFGFPKIPNLTVRAARPLPDDQLKKFTTLVSARTFSKDAYPDLKLLTSRQIISVLCGSFRRVYWDQLVASNKDVLSGPNPEKVLGETAYAVKWPGCPFVQVKPDVKYVVKTGDTAFDVYKAFTGATGSPEAIEKYFQTSAIPDLWKIKPGQTLVPAHITASTPVVASLGVQEFKSAFSYSRESPEESVGPVGSVNATPWFPNIPTQSSGAPFARPKFEIAAGRIESTASSDTYESPDECKQASSTVPPFDPRKLTNAYKDSLEAVTALHLDSPTVKVTIADNGFFGARLESGKLKFGPQFPDRFFTTGAIAGDGQIGPIVRKVDNQPVYPINYSNNKPKATFISGHGTHVTGLAIGGTEFQPYLSIFDSAPNRPPWLRLWIINVGDGEEYLLPNSADELSNRLNLLQGNIVNLSIQYASPATTTDTDILRILDGPTNNLFVVAAGNNGQTDVTDVPYYPAMLGGVSQRNVISVAAHRSDGLLARFSNRGKSNVDLAAPGCDLSSWLDDSGTVSKISGTSQAAAVVTFAAILLKSLGDLAPIEIKNRLMISGDVLLHRPVGYAKPTTVDPSLPDPAQVLSRARLNIVRSLFLFDDYVRYRAADGTFREALGTLQGIVGVRCADPIDWQNVWSIKTGDDGLLVYKGKKSPQLVAQSPCEATATSGAELRMKVRVMLDDNGLPVPPKINQLTVPVSSLDQFVSASKPYRKQL